MTVLGRKNIFARLMPSRPAGAGSEPRSFGREDFVTEAVAAVLEADARSGGTLTHSVLRALFGISLDGPVSVGTQVEYVDRGAGVSRVDLVIVTPNDVCFLENKTGSGIGLRDDRQSGASIDQLAKYRRELDALDPARVPPDRRHLAMLTWSPEDDPGDLTYWRGQRRWWDLHVVIAAAPASASEHVNALRAELLELFEQLDLAPPRALRRDTLGDAPNTQRLIAMALHACGVAELRTPRPGSGATYLFETVDPDASWSFGFSGGQVFARVVNDGYREVMLPEAFFDATVEEQVEALAHLLRTVRAAPRDTKRTDAITAAEFVARFAEASLVARELVERALAHGWLVHFRAAETTFEHPTGMGTLYVSAGYAAGPRFRIWCGKGDACAVVGEVVRTCGLSFKQSGESLLVPFAELDRDRIDAVLVRLRADAERADLSS